MTWMSAFIQFETPLEQQNHFEGNIQIKKINDVVFYGVVTEDEGKKPVSGALVKIFARIADNKEVPLCHSISDCDGHYLLNVDKGKIPADATAIIVRASAGNYSSCNE